MGNHENLQRTHDVPLPSERSFGWVMAIAFAVFGSIPWYKRGTPNLYLYGIALAFLVSAFVCPRALRPLNILWTKLGLLLGKIMTPIVMGIVFFGVVTPISLVMRLMGKDPLSLKYEKDAASYWIVRNPPGPKGETLRHQF